MTDAPVPLDEARRRQQPQAAPAWQAPNPAYKSPQLRVVDPITLHDKTPPERRWIVPGWIPHGQVTMLSGDGGVGKSLAAMQLMTACATDQKWLGVPTMHCKAVGVFCEDDEDELWRRQEAINRHYGVEFGDLENMQWLSRPCEDNALVAFEKFETPGEPTEFFQQVHDWMQEFGAQLLILDSLHDLFPGNENNRVQARQFINLLRRFAMDSDGAVVLTAHPSLSGLNTGSGMSGSTAWNNAVRSRLYLTRPKDDDGNTDSDDDRVLHRKKANYAGQGDRLDLSWKDGVLVAEDQPGGVFAGIEQRSAEQAFLDGLEALASQRRFVSPARNAGNYGPKMIAATKYGKRHGRGGLTKAMERLFDMGKIRVEGYGRPHDTRQRIAAVKDGEESDDG